MVRCEVRLVNEAGRPIGYGDRWLTHGVRNDPEDPVLGQKHVGITIAGVVTRSEIRTKYPLTDEFLEELRHEITRNMQMGTFMYYSDLSVFNACGIISWSAEDLETVVARQRQRWMRKAISQAS